MSFLEQTFYHWLMKFSKEDELRNAYKDKKDLETDFRGRTVRKLSALFGALCESEGTIEVQKKSIGRLIETVAKVGLFKPGINLEMDGLVSSLIERQLTKGISLKADFVIASLMQHGALIYAGKASVLMEMRLKESQKVAAQMATNPEAIVEMFIKGCSGGYSEAVIILFKKLPPSWVRDNKILEAIFQISNDHSKTLIALIQNGLLTQLVNKEQFIQHILKQGNEAVISIIASMKEFSDRYLLLLGADGWGGGDLFQIWKSQRGDQKESPFNESELKTIAKNMAQIGNEEGLRWVVGKLPEKDRRAFLNGTTDKGKTLLYHTYEAIWGEKAALFLLLEQGVECNIRTAGIHPIEKALKRGWNKLSKEISQRMKLEELKEILESTDIYKDLIENGNVEMLEFLRSKGISNFLSWISAPKSYLIYKCISTEEKEIYLRVVDFLIENHHRDAFLPILFSIIESALRVLSEKELSSLKKLLKHVFDRYTPEEKKVLLNTRYSEKPQSYYDFTPFQKAVACGFFAFDLLLDHGAEVKGIIPFIKNLFSLEAEVRDKILKLAPEKERESCLNFSQFDEMVLSGELVFSSWLECVVVAAGKEGEKVVADKIKTLLESKKIGERVCYTLLRVIPKVLRSEWKGIYALVLKERAYWLKDPTLNFNFLRLHQCGDFTLLLQFPGGVRQIAVDKEVLASRSLYFKGLFSGNFAETREGKKVFELHSKEEAEEFETLIDFLFSGRVTITHENFKSLAFLAVGYGADALIKELGIWIDRHPECAHWKGKYLHNLSPIKAERRDDQDGNTSKKQKGE